MFSNEFWPVLYKGMLPVVEKHWDSYLTDFVNKYIFSKVSFSKVFPWFGSCFLFSTSESVSNRFNRRTHYNDVKNALLNVAGAPDAATWLRKQ